MVNTLMLVDTGISLHIIPSVLLFLVVHSNWNYPITSSEMSAYTKKAELTFTFLFLFVWWVNITPSRPSQPWLIFIHNWPILRNGKARRRTVPHSANGLLACSSACPIKSKKVNKLCRDIKSGISKIGLHISPRSSRCLEGNNRVCEPRRCCVLLLK